MIVELKNNPGIAGARLYVGYDAKLTFVSVEYGTELLATKGAESPDTSSNPILLVWSDMETFSYDAVFATFTFTVPNNAAVGDIFIITLASGEGEICDINENDVLFTLENGKILIVG